MILFLTSNIGGVKKENGEKKPTPFFEENGFLNNLRNSLSQRRKLVLISSDPDNYDINDFYLKIDKEAFKLSNLEFEESIVIDRRNCNNISTILSDCDLIVLSGGDTFIQNKFFKEINLKKHLVNTKAVIVGISAGSINSASNVYNSPESLEDLELSPYMKGLGLTEINIEPHFILEEKTIQREAVLKESYKRTLIALTDGAYILQNNSDCKIYGLGYEIKEGSIIKICEDNQSKKIK